MNKDISRKDQVNGCIILYHAGPMRFKGEREWMPVLFRRIHLFITALHVFTLDPVTVPLARNASASSRKASRVGSFGVVPARSRLDSVSNFLS